MKTQLSLLLLTGALFVGCSAMKDAAEIHDLSKSPSRISIQSAVAMSGLQPSSVLLERTGPPTTTRLLGEYEVWEWKAPNGQTFAWVAVKDGRVVGSEAGRLAKPRMPEQWLSEHEETARKVTAELAALDATKRQRRDTYLAAHPDRPEKIRQWITEGKIGTGMSTDDVQAAWGRPDRKHVSDGNFGRHEQWVFSRAHVFFDDGKVTSWSYSE